MDKYPVGPSGYVALIDVMGDEAAIVDAARQSYGKGTRKRSGDQTLIRYLLRHKHTTPFEMVDLKFHIRCPMSVWRQWIRHRTASVNEYSTRYSEAIDDVSYVTGDEWRLQSSINKQGSDDSVLPLEPGRSLTYEQRDFHKRCKALYRKKLDLGVSRELARDDLPLGTYTEATWKMNLHNLLHFLALRLDPHAQLEIREFASAIAKIVKELFPNVWQAFEDYELRALKLTALEVTVIRKINEYRTPITEEEFMTHFQHPDWAKLERCRERDECMAKLERLGVLEW